MGHYPHERVPAEDNTRDRYEQKSTFEIQLEKNLLVKQAMAEELINAGLSEEVVERILHIKR